MPEFLSKGVKHRIQFEALVTIRGEVVASAVRGHVRQAIGNVCRGTHIPIDLLKVFEGTVGRV